MNKEEILAMEAGKALNLIVAEKVIGLIAWQEKRGEYTHIVFQNPDDREPYRKSRNWEKEMDRYKRIKYSEIDNHNHVIQEIKSYSSDISAAWEVVEKLRPTHIYELADFGRNRHKQCQHYAAFHPINKPRDFERQVNSKTLPEAICKAALLTLVEL